VNIIRRVAQVLFPPKKPCYRCGIEANPETDFAGYHYCTICADVVSVMQAAVSHDPPFGVPGGPGYRVFPVRKVREGARGNG
jgi:hypothetical protein